MKRTTLTVLVMSAAMALFACADAVDLRVETSTRSPHSTTDEAMREFARRTAALSERTRALRRAHLRSDIPFSLPARIFLTSGGRDLPVQPAGRNGDPAITLVFDSAGTRVFPSDYRAFLESVFASARPAMDAVFGVPAVGGTVRVRNFDADIQDRYAVAGGYFVPNAPDGPEIRFPVYQNPVNTAVNFVHVLLLAYKGDRQYPADAFGQGLVRAAVMRVARQAGSIPLPPGYTSSDIEAVLDAQYDLSEHYDWNNHRSLSATRFIAPNLLDAPLPVGGSTGGIFLLRLQMAGTAWAKVLVEYPGFIAEFNRRFAANPSLYQTEASLVALGQEVLDHLRGIVGATVEGRSFSDWHQRQFALRASDAAGLKVQPQVFPLAPISAADFGVFGIELNAFLSLPNGNEILLNGTSFPLFWEPGFVRFFGTAQDDQVRVLGGYGSVAPNFVADRFNNQPYRVAVDLPFGDRIERVYLPAGAVFTPTGTQHEVYGTLTGLPTGAHRRWQVTLYWQGGSQSFPVSNLAFGGRITDQAFRNAQRVTAVVEDLLPGAPTEVFRRAVNKGVGTLALDLRSPDSDTTFTLGLGARLAAFGLPLQPFDIRAESVMGLTPGTTLLARWNPSLHRYALYPDEGQALGGLAYFTHWPTAGSVPVRGTVDARTPIAVALKPGWNMVSVPFQEATPFQRVQVAVGTEPVTPLPEVLGSDIGNTLFGFVPDPFLGDRGTMEPVSQFEPGRMVFVRVLRPQGAVLLFTPTSFLGTTGLTSASSQELPAARRGEPGLWELTLRIRQVGGGSARAVVGQSPRATRGFDPAFDSGLPPGPGGLQLVVRGPEPMFRDIRTSGRRESFSLSAVGLIPGRRYILEWTLQGMANPELTDMRSQTSRRISRSGRIGFTADGVERAFEVRVGGQW